MVSFLSLCEKKVGSDSKYEADEAHNTMGKMWMTQSIFDPLEMSETVAPRNPRDHSILEAIWQGMLESRFVNSTPLSLLPTYLEYHFKGGSKNSTPLACLFI